MAHQLTLNTTALEELKAKALALPAALDPIIVEDIATAISNKGVTVPDGTELDGMAALIESIEAGSGGEMQVAQGTFTPSNESLVSYPIVVSGLLFRPKILYIEHNANNINTDTGYLYGLTSALVTDVGVSSKKTYIGRGVIWCEKNAYGNNQINIDITDDGFTITSTATSVYGKILVYPHSYVAFG